MNAEVGYLRKSPQFSDLVSSQRRMPAIKAEHNSSGRRTKTCQCICGTGANVPGEDVKPLNVAESFARIAECLPRFVEQLDQDTVTPQCEV